MTKCWRGIRGPFLWHWRMANRVKDLVELVNKRLSAIGELIHKKKVLVSVNQEIAHEDTEIQEGDEIALLPPFAGGAPMEPMVIDEQPVRSCAAGRFLRRSRRSIGCVAGRSGSAASRFFSARPEIGPKGRDVDSITFEHYEGMAQKKLREIRERALKDFDIIEFLISIGTAKSRSVRISC